MKILFIVIVSISGLLSQDMGYKMYNNGTDQCLLGFGKKGLKIYPNP